MTCHRLAGTNGLQPAAIRHKTLPLPRSIIPSRSPSKTTVAVHVAPPTAGQANASPADLLDLISSAFVSASQDLIIKVLRRPLESTQYVSIRYTERLAEVGIEPSVGSRGDSYENALAESIIGLYKTELIRRRSPWRGVDDVEFATLEWVHWYNNQRLLQPIGNIPPIEHELNYYREQEGSPVVARLN